MKAPNGGYSDNGRKPVSFVCFTEKRNSMKAGIVTFHGANNYGAVLQAYALTQWLGQNGVDAEIINYQSGVFDKYRLFRTWNYKKEPYMLGVDFVKYSEKKKRNQNFDAFRRRFLPISEKVYRKESDFEGIADQYDYYAVPSFFDGKKKLFEAHLFMSYENIRDEIRRVLDYALAETLDGSKA